MYILNIDKGTDRILSAYSVRNPPKDAIIVNALPDGNLPDYLYKDGEYIYDPLPKTEQPKPQPTQEERIKALEAQLAAYETAYAEGVDNA